MTRKSRPIRFFLNFSFSSDLVCSSLLLSFFLNHRIATLQIFADFEYYGIAPEDMDEKSLREHVQVVETAEEAADDAHAIAIMTEWKV